MPRYDAQTALIIVDAQNDFADPKGSLYVKGGEDALKAINEETRRAQQAGAMVVYTQDWHPADTPHFAKDGGIWPEHCVADTWGAEFHPGLDVVRNAASVKKGVGGEDGYSGFSVRDPVTGDISRTELEPLLRKRDIERAVVVGLATDYCVKATAIDAANFGFETTVLERGIRAVDLQPGDGEKALEEMRAAGVSVE